MENQYLSLQLIRNTYEVNEGESIVNQLIADKVNFLKKQIFKLEERQGIQSPFLESRLEELNQNIAQLGAFMRGVDNENQEMLIFVDFGGRVAVTYWVYLCSSFPKP